MQKCKVKNSSHCQAVKVPKYTSLRSYPIVNSFMKEDEKKCETNFELTLSITILFLPRNDQRRFTSFHTLFLFLFRSTKSRIWRYFRLSSRRSDNDNKFDAQNSAENSITQVNTTETMDIETNISHARKSSQKHHHHQHQHNSRSLAAKTNTLTSLHATANALRAKQLAEKQQQHHHRSNEKRRSSGGGKLVVVHGSKDRIERLHLPDDMNNSCSNITASTYLNGNEISGTSVGMELEHDGDAAVVRTERKHSGGIVADRDSMYSGISNDRMSHHSHDMVSESGGNLLSLRRESSSTYERDMDIIDLLERERSVLDMQDVIECERQRSVSGDNNDQRKFVSAKNVTAQQHMAARPSAGERRKLPDITKITTISKLTAATVAPLSPKQRLISTGSSGGGGGSGSIDLQQHHQSTNFPNFVFTHQYNEFAEAKINRNRDVNSVVVSINPNTSSSADVSGNTASAAVLMGRSRNNSQTSFGGGGGGGTAGSKRNSDAFVWNDDDNAIVGVNRVTRARSIDSRKSSTKSNHSDMMRGASTTAAAKSAATAGGSGSILSNNYVSSAYANNL